MTSDMPKYPQASQEMLRIGFGLQAGHWHQTVWLYSGWMVVNSNYLPVLGPGSLMEVICNWFCKPAPLQIDSRGAFYRKRLWVFIDVSRSFARVLTGAGNELS